MRVFFKWLLGISIGVLIALILFTIFCWALFGATAMFLQALTAECGNISSEELSLAGFLRDFVGSPMFYMYIADLSVFVLSVVGLVATRSQKPK